MADTTEQPVATAIAAVPEPQQADSNTPDGSERSTRGGICPIAGQSEERAEVLRALSHDMTANLMLLEDSLRRLKRAIGRSARDDLGEVLAHLEACLQQSKRFAADVAAVARTGHVDMKPGLTDTATVVEEVLFEQRSLLASRNVQVELRRPLRAVWCHDQRLKQVLTNLVRNAVLHGCDRQQPRITIGADSQAAATGHRFVVLYVHDNGPGIDPRFHEAIFQPGTRLGGGAAEGSGMGLAIVRRIAEYYGGWARVDPRCAKGTTIEVALPAGEAERSGRSLEAGLLDPASRSLGVDTPHDPASRHPHQCGFAAPR